VRLCLVNNFIRTQDKIAFIEFHAITVSSAIWDAIKDFLNQQVICNQMLLEAKSFSFTSQKCLVYRESEM